ncbi:MAG TPA: hypothetical protein DEQ20_05450 [Desulfobulbaceae bacterium]|nr:hypothetical protein [Desulfobulbaceae bacterium]
MSGKGKPYSRREQQYASQPAEKPGTHSSSIEGALHALELEKQAWFFLCLGLSHLFPKRGGQEINNI